MMPVLVWALAVERGIECRGHRAECMKKERILTLIIYIVKSNCIEKVEDILWL